MPNQEDIISKKDLLLETGISYGQLYRWKRQNLIPDGWFMKQSSFTGQETFFPKRKVLERINAILALKDTHSFEEMTELFSPVSINKTFFLLDVIEAIEMEYHVASLCIELWGKHRFSFQELLLIDLYAALRKDADVTEEEGREWLLTAKRWVTELNDTELQVIVVRKRSLLQYVMLEASSRYYLDEYSRLVQRYDLSERSKLLNEKLQKWMEG